MPTKNVDQLVIPIPGSYTLKEITNVIRFHEGYLWKFTSNTVEGNLNKSVLVPSPDVPPDFEFGADTTQYLNGKKREWIGKVLYDGIERTVAVFRAIAP